MDEPKSAAHPFDSAFRTLVALCPQLLIPVVNELFGTTFTYADKVILMDPKQMVPAADGEIATREVDSLFTINGDLMTAYHVECQSRLDNTMVVRFWEYDSHIAMANASITEDGVMEVAFPRSAVLYLRHNRNTPDALKIKMRKHDGTAVELCEIPIVKTQRYTLDELLEKGLLFLIPFYAFTHESELAEYDADEGKIGVLLGEIERIKRRLAEEMEAGHIGDFERAAIHASMMSVFRGLGGGLSNVMKGVESAMGGEILDFPARRVREDGIAIGMKKGMAKGMAKGRTEGRAEGRAEGMAKGRTEGRAEGELNAYIGLVRDNIMEPSVAAARLHISESEFRAKYDAAPDNVF